MTLKAKKENYHIKKDYEKQELMYVDSGLGAFLWRRTGPES